MTQNILFYSSMIQHVIPHSSSCKLLTLSCPSHRYLMYGLNVAKLASVHLITLLRFYTETERLRLKIFINEHLL